MPVKIEVIQGAKAQQEKAQQAQQVKEVLATVKESGKYTDISKVYSALMW